MPRFVTSLAVFFLVVPLTGCLVTHHHSKVIREDEQRLPIAFQSSAAEAAVNEIAMDESKRQVAGKGNVLAIPFILWLSSDTVMSENAWYNDQVQKCDRNKDHRITENEARTYNPTFADNWSPVEIARINGEEPDSAASVQNAAHAQNPSGKADVLFE